MYKKRIAQALVASVLLGSLTIQAEPFKNWFWTDPTTYVNGQTIPPGDLTNTTLKCGMQSGGPYPAIQVFTDQVSPSSEDMAFVVAGVPGTYYCVATVSSIQYQSESGNSGEVSFTVAPGALGFVPNPPTLSLQ